jgi:ribosomal protein L11 methylase PrmA
VKEGGRVIVSGFGENQIDEMKGLFTDMGFIISQDLGLNGWGALAMELQG